MEGLLLPAIAAFGIIGMDGGLLVVGNTINHTSLRVELRVDQYLIVLATFFL